MITWVYYNITKLYCCLILPFLVLYNWTSVHFLHFWIALLRMFYAGYSFMWNRLIHLRPTHTATACQLHHNELYITGAFNSWCINNLIKTPLCLHFNYLCWGFSLFILFFFFLFVSRQILCPHTSHKMCVFWCNYLHLVFLFFLYYSNYKREIIDKWYLTSS